MAEVMLPTLTTWGRPFRKSSIQRQREVFSPSVPSLVTRLEGTMVLNAELYSMNSVLTLVFLLCRWVRAVWSAIEIVSSMDLLVCKLKWV